MMRSVIVTVRSASVIVRSTNAILVGVYFMLVVVNFIRSDTGGDTVGFVAVEEDGAVWATGVDGHLLVTHQTLLGDYPRVAFQDAEYFVFGESEVLGGGDYFGAN